MMEPQFGGSIIVQCAFLIALEHTINLQVNFNGSIGSKTLQTIQSAKGFA